MPDVDVGWRSIAKDPQELGPPGGFQRLIIFRPDEAGEDVSDELNVVDD